MRSRSAASLLRGQGFTVESLEGGIDAWNGLVSTGEYEAGMTLIEGKESPEELIALAWGLEDGTRVFYERAGEALKDKDAEEVFSALVKAEQKHKERLLEAYRALRPGASPDSLKSEGLMEGGVSVDDALSWLGARGAGLAQVLEASMQLETNALDFYMKFRRNAVDGAVKEVLDSLIEEEKAHLRRLGTLLEEKLQ